MDVQANLQQAIFAAGFIPWISAAFGTIFVLLLAGALTKIIVNATIPDIPPLRYADLCAYQKVDKDGITLCCNRSRIARIWHLTGMDHGNLDVHARNIAFNSRARALTSLSQIRPAPILRFISFRDQSITNSQDQSGFTIPTDPDWPVAGMIREKWLESFKNDPVYHNQHFLIADVPDSKAGRKALETIGSTIGGSLQEYSPVLLRANPQNKNDIHLLEPLAKLLSPASMSIPKGHANAWLPDVLCNNKLTYQGKGIFKFSSREKTHYMAIVGIRRLPDQISEAPILALAGIPSKCTIVHVLRPVSATQSLKDIGLKKNRMAHIASKKASFEKLSEVSELLQGTHVSGRSSRLHDYSTAIYVYADNLEKLQENLDMVWRVLIPSDIAPITEGIAAQSCWWQAQPGFQLFPRAYRFLSEQAAALILPENIPSGQTTSDWAPVPLMYARTIQNSAYEFQFHPTPDQEAAGHTVIIAPTGRGKTTIACMMAAHVLGIPEASVQLFDRNFGCESFVRCCGGTYLGFHGSGDSSQMASLNPMQMEDTPQNRSFIKTWLTDLIPDPEPEDRQDVSRCVEMLFTRFRKEERSLENVHTAAFPAGSRAKTWLDPWTDPDQYGPIFNSPRDSIREIMRESPVPLIGYDCTDAFENPLLSGPLINYLSYQIRQNSPGKPTLAFIDETEPLLDNANFRRTYQIGLQEGRKLRHVYISCFQRPNAIERTGMSQLIRGQCPTIIFAQNQQAQPEDYKSFELSDGELSFILGHTIVDTKRAFLVKRYDGPHTAILNLDMEPLGNLLKVFSSGRSSVQDLRNALRGRDPREAVLDWLGILRKDRSNLLIENMTLDRVQKKLTK